MPTIIQSDNPSNSIQSPGLTLMDEFLPYISLNAEKFKQEDPKTDGETIRSVKVKDNEHVKLSKYLDKAYKGDNGSKNIILITTTEIKFKIPFKVIKGCSDSKDEDGLLKFKLKSDDKEVKLSYNGNKKTENILKEYGSHLDVEVEITSKEEKAFYIEFYASDNGEEYFDGDNQGELTNQFVGKIKVHVKKIILAPWMDIAWKEYSDWSAGNWTEKKGDGLKRANKYIKKAGVNFKANAKAWCGCFVDWVVKTTNETTKSKFSTVSVNPSGSLNYWFENRYPKSKKIEPSINFPPYGMITVLRYGSKWEGHVGFLINFEEKGKKKNLPYF